MSYSSRKVERLLKPVDLQVQLSDDHDAQSFKLWINQ